MTPRRLDVHVAAKVTAGTLTRYREGARMLSVWAIPKGYTPSTSAEWDDVLMEFKSDQYISKANFTNVVAALEFFFPHLKGTLKWSHQALAGWNIAEPIKHTVALGKVPACLVSLHMNVRGYARLGVGCVLQVETGLRPSEMLGVLPEDIALPSDAGLTLEQRPASIALAPRTGTKLKRAQVVMLRSHQKELIVLLDLLRALTPPG